MLALLAESPMHVYRMQQLIKERAQDSVVNVGSRNSLHQTIRRLVSAGLVGEGGTSGSRGRTTYELTRDGAEALSRWLDDMLAEPHREYPEFPAALAFVVFREPAALADLLERRVSALRRSLAQPTPAEVAADLGIARVFLLEDEYRRAMIEAELDWLRATIAELRRGTLSWTTAAIGRLAR